ncbi:precorrin-2 dehydrogenase/sirohydrochlorin ferrochelatase family protein [Methanobrevibacter filiformis]|uniref:precorrin-2 dehydrogenase n=1 Tax=Methanobrevibacter filiformis TaxID=55758 RepID=A0A166AKZ4_9EURY|nr:bifunctional precorrin-2 dehydrogenase/sirohydrochlorin ferrochelatase [Methanobrevibacter filiformis]KZX12171.1 precorrin-2 dehydrogenase [Methanobrevibacter filiformis]
MEGTSLFLKTNDKKVLIIGSGEVGSRRAERFLDTRAEVIIVGNTISDMLKDKGATLKSIKSKEDVDTLVKWADIIIIASGDNELNEYVGKVSKDMEKLVNRADYPEKGNIIVPTKFKIADIEISIYTQGKSPLVAKKLREKLEKAISEKDILEIEVQDHVRSILKDKIDSQKKRKEILYEIANNNEIVKLISEGKLNTAKKYAEDIINS